ncbi:hypothetical protein DMH15_10705 [Streptomyces sp. WAC 06725]|nr:hypothetical protein DMH15_10705 [Streptomyces sp. WAC 06725]
MQLLRIRLSATVGGWASTGRISLASSTVCRAARRRSSHSLGGKGQLVLPSPSSTFTRGPYPRAAGQESGVTAQSEPYSWYAPPFPLPADFALARPVDKVPTGPGRTLEAKVDGLLKTHVQRT